MLIFRAGIHKVYKLLVRIANREDPAQVASWVSPVCQGHFFRHSVFEILEHFMMIYNTIPFLVLSWHYILLEDYYLLFLASLIL